MNALVLYECSGTVREAFLRAGHNALSVDLKPSDNNVSCVPLGAIRNHMQANVFTALRRIGEPMFGGWMPDIIIAHPPCTYLCSSGLHWNKRRPERAEQTQDALAHVFTLIKELDDLDIPYAIENPIGCLSTQWRKPDQIIQPWQFGDDASKATCLWLHRLPKLVPLPQEDQCPPRFVERNGKTYQRWANQTDSGQNRLGPSDHRAADRAQTYPGIARAMAAQWGAAQ